MSDDLFDVFNEELPPPVALAELNNRGFATTTAGASPQNVSADNIIMLDDDADPKLTNSESCRDGLRRNTVDVQSSSTYSFLSRSDTPTQQQSLTDTAPRTSMTPPLPLPILTPMNTSSTGSKSKALMIIHSSPTSESHRNNNSDATPTTPSRTTPPPPSSAVFTEPHSRIRVRRATVALEQLAVRLAEFPYASFALFRQAAARGDAQAPVPQTCVGVVTRKSDPKQSTTKTRSSRYAIFTLWSMENISPTPETEVRFLLCGDAFELLYSQLVRGSVVALSNVGMCSRKGGSNNNSSAGNNLDVLFRASDHTSVRQLGFAADLGTCTSMLLKSNERCHAIVNTTLSQHCTYHVGDLRKVARGTAGGGGTPSSGSSARRSAMASSLASSSSNIPVVKGGALTSHMKLPSSTGAHRGGTTLSRTAVTNSTIHPSSSSFSQKPLNARLAVSQQLLRQPSFFAVRGATGLPVEDAAQRRELYSAGTGVYGCVHSGAPLPLKQRVGLRPAERYPSAQELGVTSRGRDVLEAARQQAVLSEEEKLLRRSQLPTEHKKSTWNDSSNGGAMSSDRNNAVGGNAVHDSNSKMRGTGKTASCIRTRDANASAEYAPADKRTRTEATPMATRLTTTTTATARASARPPTSPMDVTATPTAADAGRVAALRQQFQPIHSGTRAAFVPLSGQCSVHTVIPSASQKDYRHTIVLCGNDGSACGGHNAQSAMLRAAAKAAKDLSLIKKDNNGVTHTTSGGGASASSSGKSPQELSKHANEEGLPLTLLGIVASTMHSEHDHLRTEADRRQLLSFVDKQIAKEKALEALEAISQQEIKAYYCYGCRCWYTQPPTTCVEQHHRTELKPALKKYIKCEHCDYKTFVIGGEDAKGWKVFPRCPRCHQASFWVRGDAAPQIAKPVEASIPF